MIYNCDDNAANYQLLSTDVNTAVKNEHCQDKSSQCQPFEEGCQDVSFVSLNENQNCQTPETANKFIFEGDTLKKCRHGYHNSVLEGCSDRELLIHKIYKKRLKGICLTVTARRKMRKQTTFHKTF